MTTQQETALITGSTSGIGKRIAEHFLKQGWKVAICSRNPEHVNKTVTEFEATYGDAVIGFPYDVADMESVKALAAKVHDVYGSIRILVANAGLNSTYGPFQYLTPDQVIADTNLVIGTNLVGIMNSISAVLPYMITQGYGRIITLSGGGAARPITNMAIYSASKGGVVAFSRCLALELKEQQADIKINILQPGMQRTGLTDHVNVVAGWRNAESVRKEADLVLEYLGGDLDFMARKVIPYALPDCKANGKVIMGFSIRRLLKGVSKLKKMQKKAAKTT
nr:SDR family oxidoreductase [Candidatus Sigynarchaeota archaeon]